MQHNVTCRVSLSRTARRAESKRGRGGSTGRRKGSKCDCTNLPGWFDVSSAGQEHQAVLVVQHSVISWIQLSLVGRCVHHTAQHGSVKTSAGFCK